jgi:hypothetical protein
MPTREEIDYALKERRSYIIAYYGSDSDEAVTKYLEDEEGKKNKSPYSRRRGVGSVEVKLGENAKEDFDNKVKEYQNAYVDVTPNDLEIIKGLVIVELQLEAIRQMVFHGKFSGEDLRSLIDAQGTLSAEYRQLQKTLGIDRRTRDNSEEEKDAVNKIDDIIEQASDYYKNKMVCISHCGIKFGHMLCHFGGWTFTATCPRCGEKFTISAKEGIEVIEKTTPITVKRGRGRPKKN